MATPRPVILYCVGCFNPVTNKHLKMMELARDSLHRTGRYKVLQGIFSPANDKYGKDGLIPATHRLEMMKLAVSSNPWLRVDSWEMQQSDWIPTALTLRELKKRLENGTVFDSAHSSQDSDESSEPKKRKINYSQHSSTEKSQMSPTTTNPITSSLSTAQIKLLCGGDLLESFSVPDLWDREHMEIIVRDFGLVVIVRDGSDPYKYIYDNDLLTKYSYNIDVVTDWYGDDSSSTKVRRALKRNDSIKYQVQDSVLEYIVKHKLYNPDYKLGLPYPSS